MRVKGMISIIRIFFGGYLLRSGWLNSVFKGFPIDAEGKALPWFTYSAISFIKSRLKYEFNVFEFGSGNSTIWFSDYVQNVYSVEHDKKWYEIMLNKVKGNSKINYTHRSLEGMEYANEILKYNDTFDIIVIDGRDRINCCYNSLSALKTSGVIIWDNSDREKYKAGYDFLLENGFKRIDFNGIGPINSDQWCTSIFYKVDNCLGI